MSYDGLPEGWVVWNDEPDGPSTLAFRPDVFDGDAHPAACLPTIHVSRRPPVRRRPLHESTSDEWHVALYLEPDVRLADEDRTRATRAAARAAAVEVARAFVEGEVAYRTDYEDADEAYLDELDALTGRDA